MKPSVPIREMDAASGSRLATEFVLRARYAAEWLAGRLEEQEASNVMHNLVYMMTDMNQGELTEQESSMLRDIHLMVMPDND
ncbi:MAG TPA: hypothetical protein VK610_09760 [Rhodothermales bacterium]|nr:hypothetical protein [Rhodothermales bacterium]